MNKRFTMVRLLPLCSGLVTVQPDDLSGSLVIHSPALVTARVPDIGPGSRVKKEGIPREGDQ